MGRFRIFLALVLLFWASAVMGAEAYSFRDSVKDIVPGGKGMPDAIDFISVIGGPGRHFSACTEDLKFFKSVAESLQSFNFRKVYDSDFLRPMKDGFRGASFRIVNTDSDFRLSMTPPGTQTPLSGDLGSFATEVSLKHNNKSPVGGNSYFGIINTDFLLKQLNEKHLLRLLDNFMRVVDYGNVRTLEREYGYDWKKSYEPFEVIDDFRTAFPSFMAWGDKYAKVRSRRVVAFHDHQSYTGFSLELVSRIDRIRKDYPGVADRLERLKGLVRFFIVLKNPAGHVLATFIVNTDEDFFFLYVVEKDGMVVPVDVSGKVQRPVFKEAFALADLARQLFSVEVTWDSKVAGMDFKTQGIRLAGNYESSQEKMLFSLKLTDVGWTRITGRAYKLVPTWVLDLIVPGNFDEIIHDFAQCMVKANKGQGSLFVLAMDKKNHRDNKLRLTASSEILDNFFIRFGLRVLSNKFSRNKDEIADSKKMYGDAMSALISDLTAMKGKNGKKAVETGKK